MNELKVFWSVLIEINNAYRWLPMTLWAINLSFVVSSAIFWIIYKTIEDLATEKMWPIIFIRPEYIKHHKTKNFVNNLKEYQPQLFKAIRRYGNYLLDYGGRGYLIMGIFVHFVLFGMMAYFWFFVSALLFVVFLALLAVGVVLHLTKYRALNAHLRRIKGI